MFFKGFFSSLLYLLKRKVRAKGYLIIKTWQRFIIVFNRAHELPVSDCNPEHVEWSTSSSLKNTKDHYTTFFVTLPTFFFAIHITDSSLYVDIIIFQNQTPKRHTYHYGLKQKDISSSTRVNPISVWPDLNGIPMHRIYHSIIMRNRSLEMACPGHK